MTKQEEIREGIRAIFNKYKKSREKCPSIDYQDFATQDVLLFLHSQGVVIKGDKPFRIGESVNDDGLVAVEPLIGEV